MASIMKKPIYDDIRYLSAKKTVDDRALNRHVLEGLRDHLRGMAQGRPLRVLEVGAGIGTMVERLTDWRILDRAVYDAIDINPLLIEEARRRIPAFAASRGHKATFEGGGGMRLAGGHADLTVSFEAADLYEFIERESGKRHWDLLICHAFLDLVDTARALPGLLSLLENGSLAWFTLTFDGVTILEPAVDPDFDDEILRCYHETMDNRQVGGKPSGRSRAGRRLLAELRTSGTEILNAGSSDWVVVPSSGRYVSDETFFLHFFIENIGRQLDGYPGIDGERLTGWLRRRHGQIERGELILIAHQLDILGMKKP